MKNVKEKVYIQSVEDINTITENEYTRKGYVEKLELHKELEKLGFKTALVYSKAYENMDLFLNEVEKITIIRLYDGHYCIGAYRRWEYVDTYGQSDIRKSLKQPNNFKVLNAKTIQAWIDYELEVIRLCNEKNIANTQKIVEFMAKVDSLQKEGNKLTLSQSGKQGWISSKYFEFNFEISDSGHISQNLRVNYSSEKTVDLFTTLSRLTN